MADYIRSTSQEQFDMSKYRPALDNTTHICNSVGCVIGHCTALISEEEFKQIPLHPSSLGVDFTLWSENFTGLKRNYQEWEWCFDSEWYYFDNTPEGAADRIEYMLKYGVPSDFETPTEADVDLY